MDSHEWRVRKGKTFLKQKNSHDCAPIACLKLMSVFGRFHFLEATSTSEVIRKTMMDEFENLVLEAKRELSATRINWRPQHQRQSIDTKTTADNQSRSDDTNIH